jgi:unsaturated rhamnogalacturonyl hydrolase
MKRLILLSALVLFPCAALSAAGPHLDRWRAVADKLVQTPPDKWPFNWGEGVQMIGLMKIHERTGDPRYADYVERWTGLYQSRDIKELLNLPPVMKRGRAGYCGHWSPGTAILYLYLARKKAEHLRLAEEVNGFILSGAERSPEGGLGHWLGSHQLWVDTLYMACPLLSGLGKLHGRKEYIEDAANQIIVQARYLQDPKTGLFYHMWDWERQTKSPDFWGRGNGWVLMSIADTMEFLDPKHPSWKALKRIAESLTRGIQATQDRDGLWHTVLDDPESYQETSAASMFAYGLLKLVRLKVLPKSHRAMATKAWAAVNEMYVKDGEVTGVSAGTGPMGGGHYRERPRGVQTWGTGAYLMAGSEIDRLR